MNILNENYPPLAEEDKVNTSFDPKIKAQWIAALRSGEYQQTKSRLRDDEGFCCLGVLTDLYIKEKGLEWKEEEPVMGFVTYTLDGHTGYPTPEVCNWANSLKWDSAIPDLKDRNEESLTLTDLNDICDLNFSQIADVVNYFF